MPKYNVYHTERAFNGGTDTRREGGPDGFDTKEEAVACMQEMKKEAIANGRPEYADALSVDVFEQ
jgi:hypothetical protein